jgi:hypothetical protein
MPVLLFTADEVARTLIARQRELSAEIRELADLKRRPLDPGESVAERHHKIAKLGKQLAETFDAFDTLIRGSVEQATDSELKPDETSSPINPRAN